MRPALVISVLVLGGCGSPEGGAEPVGSRAGEGGTSSSGGSVNAVAGASSGGDGSFAGASASAGTGAASGSPNVPSRPRCRAPAGLGSPGTIQQTVALLNALPKPVTVACFVESLDRPLTIAATSSIFSAQPAHSAASPRVFINIGQTWMSVVVDGEASELLEFGQLLPLEEQALPRSIKAELHFPIEETLQPGAPYERVLYREQGTLCQFCHAAELAESVPGIDNVFSSVALKPRLDTYVSTETLRIAAQNCDATLEPHRCEMLSAIFDGGLVVEGTFPKEMPTFF